MRHALRVRARRKCGDQRDEKQSVHGDLALK